MAAAAPPGWQIDRSTFDASVSPCADFYQHVCGGFAARTEVPADRTARSYLRDRAQASTDRIVADLLAGATSGEPPVEIGRLRAFYAACITPDDAANTRALRARLAVVDKIQTRADVQPALRALNAEGFPIVFQYTGEPDRADRTKFRGQLGQGELGEMRIYREDLSARRAAYRGHVETMLALAGSADPRADSAAVLLVESALAFAALTGEDAFDPAISEHPTTPAQLRQLAPHLDWRAILAQVGHPGGAALNVPSPRYLQRADHVLADNPLHMLRAFFRWRILDTLGTALPGKLGDEAFAWQADPGTAPPPRDARCRLETIKAMGVELSRQFARAALGDAARAQATRDAALVVTATAQAAAATPWLSPEGRAAIARKVAATRVKAGYPETWPETGDYAVTGAMLDNVIAARGFETQRSWRKARALRPTSPHDDPWDNWVQPNGAPGIAAARLMFANGFPDMASNAIEFMAAILRAPMYDAAAPIEVRLGGFGYLAGHELVHVLDNHEFDEHGEAHDLLGPVDAKAHLAQVGCVIDQANRYEVDGQHFHGERTFGELDADYGGIAHAYTALGQQLGRGLSTPGPDGTTAAQRFFFAYAQLYCQAPRPDARDALRNDNHGPVQFRVNGPLSNLPGFAEAFGCPAGSAMARPASDRCTVW